MKAQQDHREILGRREFLGTALAVSATALIRPAFGADAVEAAKSEQGLLWYDHYDRKDALTLMQTFQKAHPFVKRVEFIDVPSAQKTSKLLQESMAGGPTADFLLNDPSAMQKLVEKGFVVKDDWAALGVKTSTATTPSDYMALVTTPVYVVLYNKNQVKDADAPDTWDAVVDPKWTGKTGHWMRAAAFLPLLPAIGEDKTRDIVRRMAATKPRMFDGLFPLAQAVGSGEIAMCVTAYDSAVRVIESGAPVGMKALDLTPADLICGGVMKYGQNPNTARLFLAWLTTDEGALTFEKLTRRGNLFVAKSKTAQFIKGRKTCYIEAAQSIKDSAHLTSLEAEFGRMLEGRA